MQAAESIDLHGSMLNHNMRNFTLILTLLSILCIGCSTDNAMIFKDKTIYSPDSVETGIQGILNFSIEDSIMILHTADNDAAWKIISLDDMSMQTGLLRKGNGPDELISIPSVSSSESLTINGELHYYINDINKRQLLDLNLSRSITEGRLHMETIRKDLPYGSFNTILINDSTYFIRALSNDQTKLERKLLENNVPTVPEELVQINSAHVKAGTWYGPLCTGLYYNRQINLLVESPVYLNNINIYTPDGSFRKSLCFGEKPVDVMDIVRYDRPEGFFHTKLYENCFAAARLLDGHTHIYIIDYEGNPVSEIELDLPSTGFDFDIAGQRLYAYDGNTESFWRYDLPEDFPESLIIN